MKYFIEFAFYIFLSIEKFLWDAQCHSDWDLSAVSAQPNSWFSKLKTTLKLRMGHITNSYWQVKIVKNCSKIPSAIPNNTNYHIDNQF